LHYHYIIPSHYYWEAGGAGEGGCGRGHDQVGAAGVEGGGGVGGGGGGFAFVVDDDDHCETAGEAYEDIAPVLRLLVSREKKSHCETAREACEEIALTLRLLVMQYVYVCMYTFVTSELVRPHLIAWGKIYIFFFTSRESPAKGGALYRPYKFFFPHQLTCDFL
jgi:hypothetical protein